MNGEISFESLRRVQMAEKKNPNLTPLETDFYQAYFNHLVNLQAKLRENFSLESAKAFESTKKVLEDTAKTREKKIIFKALADFEENGIDTSGMATEEKELYNSLITILSAYKPGSSKNLTDLSSNNKPLMNSKITDSKKIRLLIDIPQFVGENGTVGPFVAGTDVELKINDAKILIFQGAAQEI